MTPVEIAAARDLAAAATPGPWIAAKLPAGGIGPWRVDAPDIDCIIGDVGEVGTDPCDAGNARFIAASRTLIPVLLDEVERLRVVVAEAAALLDAAASLLSDCGHYTTATAMRTDASRYRREGGV